MVRMIGARIQISVRNIPDLKTADEIADKVFLSPDRLNELAEQGFAPCWRIDDGRPLFQLKVIKQWVAENLCRIQEGARPPTVFMVPSFPDPKPGDIPPVLRGIRGLHEAPVADAQPICGVYFLCDGDEVVYVGQSVHPRIRIGTHAMSADKKGKFNRAFVVGCLEHHLTDVENAFIRLLKPRLNNGFPSSNIENVDEIINSMKS